MNLMLGCYADWTETSVLQSLKTREVRGWRSRATLGYSLKQATRKSKKAIDGEITFSIEPVGKACSKHLLLLLALRVKHT
jgi:hypothetical protein